MIRYNLLILFLYILAPLLSFQASARGVHNQPGSTLCRVKCAKAGEDVYDPGISCKKGQKVNCCDNSKPINENGKMICPSAKGPRQEQNQPGKTATKVQSTSTALKAEVTAPSATSSAVTPNSTPQTTTPPPNSTPTTQSAPVTADAPKTNAAPNSTTVQTPTPPPSSTPTTTNPQAAADTPKTTAAPTATTQTDAPKADKPLVGTMSGNYKLLFVDYFQNLDQWKVETGLDTYTNTCGAYTKENVTANNGLTLKVGPKTNNAQGKCCKGPTCIDQCVLSGRVSSTFSKKYGVFIFNAKIPRGADLFPALWLTGIGTWPQSGEFDLLESVDSIKARPDFSARIIVPGKKDLSGYVSLPPDNLPENKHVGAEDFWSKPHVYALDWHETPDKDVKYDVYLDVIMDNGVLVNVSDNKKATPIKSYSLKDLVNKYRNYDCKCSWIPKYDLPPFEKIRDALKPHQMVMNIAVGGGWNSKKDNQGGCNNKKCGGCDQINDAMTVEYVQVWDKN